MSDIDLRIVSGGRPDPAVEVAIGQAVEQVIRSRERSQPTPRSSGWAHAARLEAVGARTVRTRAALPPT